MNVYRKSQAREACFRSRLRDHRVRVEPKQSDLPGLLMGYRPGGLAERDDVFYAWPAIGFGM